MNGSMVLFNRMLISGREAGSFETYAYDSGFRGWITTKVSQTLLEELPGIIGQIIDMLIAKFEEWTVAFQTMGDIVEVTMGERGLIIEHFQQRTKSLRLLTWVL